MLRVFILQDPHFLALDVDLRFKFALIANIAR